MIKESRLKGIFEEQKGKKRILYTKSLVPGVSIYGEKLTSQGRDEFREWIPNRSKLCAAILKGISQIGIMPGKTVLYLGASTGTTVSHVSDIVGENGFIFALDSAPRTTRQLVYLCEQRKNIAPILADAKNIEQYKSDIPKVDIIYMDIAQKDQVGIFLNNIENFLDSRGFAILCLKARSINVVKKPRDVFKIARTELEKKVVIVDYRELFPFERDHAFFVCKKK